MHADPYSPYAPPNAGYRTNVVVPAGQIRGVLPSPSLRVWKLVLGIVTFAIMTVGIGLMAVGAVIASREGMGVFYAGLAVEGLSYVVLLATLVVSLVWLYRFWSWLPPDQRYANLWKRYISPGAAVGFMLVPYFNLFWMFVIYLGTCDALERMRVAYPTAKPAPKGMAIATVIVSLVFFPVAIFLDYFFDKEVEAMAAEMEPKIPPAA